MDDFLFSFAPEALVKRTQAPYVRFFVEGGAKRVLDVGCGRGIFLDLLRSHNIQGEGIDGSEFCEKCCTQKGYTVFRGDAIETLETLCAQGQVYDGIFCSHLIEHMAPEQGLKMLGLMQQLLRSQGRLMFVTPNPSNPRVMGESFWLDPTHVRPYPRKLIEAFATQLGLKVVASFDDMNTASKKVFPVNWISRLLRLLTLGKNTEAFDAVVVLRRG